MQVKNFIPKSVNRSTQLLAASEETGSHLQHRKRQTHGLIPFKLNGRSVGPLDLHHFLAVIAANASDPHDVWGWI
jgi:hypothetical protein